jgi:hypothetical protein
VGFIAVYQNGVMLGSTDYTATNGTTVVLAVGALVGDLISTESFLVSSVLNAIPNSPASVGSSNIVSGVTLTTPTLVTPVLSGSVTGTYTLAGTGTLSSPIISGTPTGVGVLTSGTAQASTSGTSIDFTGIPSWAKRITVMFNGVSTNGVSSHLIQLGTSGGIQSTGYNASAVRLYNSVSIASAQFTTGFGDASDEVTALNSGAIIICSMSSNIWAASGNIGQNGVRFYILAGSVTLSGTLDRVRITTVNGTDTFDAGSINILFE